MNAAEISSGWDVIIVHDPQPAASARHVPDKARPGSGAATSTSRRPTRTRSSASCRSCGTTTRRSGTCQQYVPGRLDGARRRCTSARPAIDPLSPKNMALSPEDAAFVCDQFGIDVDRPLMCQVSRFDPWKDPIGVIDAYRLVTRGDARGAARADRLDGHGRPRGLGVLQLDDGLRRRRPRHPHPQQPQQRRRDRGERLPVAGRRGDPEVHPRGLRADRLRGALEGRAPSSAATSAASRSRSRTARPASSSPRPRSAPTAPCGSCASPTSASSSAARARSTCARTS